MNEVSYEDFLTAYFGWANTYFKEGAPLHCEENVNRLNAWNHYIFIRDRYLKSCLN